MRWKAIFTPLRKEMGMNPAVALKGILEGRFVRKPDMGTELVPGRQTILIAGLDPEIRNGLSQSLAEFPINTLWVKSAEDARSVLASMEIAALFCEIWLEGGTCRELIWSVRRNEIDLPIIVVPPPNCPNEYRTWLAALNEKALYFLFHPYKSSDLDGFVQMAIGAESQAAHR
jgi:DNA-binding NtrC family response regulator